jgi:hypothetical protein
VCWSIAVSRRHFGIADPRSSPSDRGARVSIMMKCAGKGHRHETAHSFVQDLSLGTITLQNGSWSSATVGISTP